MSRRVTIHIQPDEIDRAIRELNDWKKWVETKTKEFLKALADEGVTVASVNFKKAVYDGDNDVRCKIEKRDENTMAVMAIGRTVLFIEFGTGVKYPDDHPEAAKHGMERGGYGYHLGKNPGGWRYKGKKGTNGVRITKGKHKGEIHTYGNPANRCLYDSMKELEDRFVEIARRIYV